MVRVMVFSKPKKITICPFAEDGMMAKQISVSGVDEDIWKEKLFQTVE